jgi:hypothetical protein
MFMRQWLIVHDLKSYRQHPDLIGHKKPDTRFRSIKQGDRIVYYAKGKKLVGIFKVSQPGRILGKDRFWDSEDLVYGIEPILRPPYSLDFEPSEFGLKMLQGTAFELLEDQYKRILSWLLGLEGFPEQMNHDMVAALFVKMHSYLGYPKIKLIQQPFPDCIALDKKGREVRIEFEVWATEFQRDPSHQIEKCDRIVCWEDDWGATAPPGKVLSIQQYLFG